MTLVVGPTQLSQTAYIRSLYPQASVTEVGPKGLEFGIVELSPDDLVRRAGLTMAESEADSAALPTVADPFTSLPALPGARRTRVWKGGLYWPTSRPVRVTVQAGPETEVRIGDIPVLPPNGSRHVDLAVELPRGWVPMVVREPTDVEHRLTIQLHDHGQTLEMSRWQLRPESERQGLDATYERDGAVILRVTDPQLNSVTDERIFPEPNAPPVHIPFVATWRGALQVTDAGRYEFEAVATGPASVSLDGQPLLNIASVTGFEPAVTYSTRQLAAGDHPIVARWDCTRCSNPWRRVFQLYWKPPGGERELVPPSHFVPERPETVSPSTADPAKS
jgi:PA14 domain-containing protein